LNPPNLGPLEVRLTLQQDQASVVFSAQQVAVRDALEAALPRLRELLEQQSLQLVQADVEDPGGQRGGRAGGDDLHRPAVAEPAADDGEVPSLQVASARQANGLVDLFA
jgi:flagellar hook-length control protein FliK